MQEKISIFSFFAALIIVFAKVLLEHADKDGNVFIKTPKQYWEEVKKGFLKFKELFKNRNT